MPYFVWIKTKSGILTCEKWEDQYDCRGNRKPCLAIYTITEEQMKRFTLSALEYLYPRPKQQEAGNAQPTAVHKQQETKISSNK